MSTSHRFHNTPSPTIVNPERNSHAWKVYRFNAAFYLNGRGMTEYGALRPAGKAPLTVGNAFSATLARGNGATVRDYVAWTVREVISR